MFYNVPVFIPHDPAMMIHCILTTHIRFKKINLMSDGNIMITNLNCLSATTEITANIWMILCKQYSFTGLRFWNCLYNLRGTTPFNVMIGLIKNGHPILFAIGIWIDRSRNAKARNLLDRFRSYDYLGEFHATLTICGCITTNSSDIQFTIPTNNSSILETHKLPLGFVGITKTHINLCDASEIKIRCVIQFTIIIGCAKMLVVLWVQICERAPRMKKQFVLGMIEGVIHVANHNSQNPAIIDDRRIHKPSTLREVCWNN